MRRLKIFGLLAIAALAILVALAAVPVAAVEMGCGRGANADVAANTPLVDDPGYRRAEGDSFMSYPEWDIVYAYADLADVTRRSSESSYRYGEAIHGFWTDLCQATETARAIGPVTLDQRVTDYIIGLSFTLEMAAQGAYEKTVGALTARMRGPEKTPEDAFNQSFLDDYARFLHQTPWYRYPFKTTLLRFWRETPWTSSSRIRSIERRVALTLEYGLKAFYAKAIGVLAGYSPADLTIMTVIQGGTTADPEGVTTIRDLGDGRRLVHTERYEAYSKILQTWAQADTTLVEIAGNRHILVTMLAPDGVTPNLPGARMIFATPLQARPGWKRVGLAADVPVLMSALKLARQQGVEFEHAYDY